MSRLQKKSPRIGAAIIWAVILLPIICLNSADTVKGLCLLMMLATLLFGVLRLKELRQRMNIPMVMLVLITAMGVISTAYAISGKFALQGALYLMTALCVALILTMYPDKSTTPGRFMATALAGTASLISLLSIDHISTRLLSAPVLSVFGNYTSIFEGISGVEENMRLTSIFDAPNVFAGCVGIGLLLSLSLTLSATCKKERRINLAMLYINALAFVLAFSMGATVSIGAAFIVYLLLERKTDRFALLVLLSQTLLIAMLGMLPISATAFQSWNGIQPVPLLCMIAGAALLCVSDHFLTQRMTNKLRGSGRKIIIFASIFAVAAVGFAVTACLWTGEIAMSEGDSLRRAVYPDAGTYTITAEHNGDVSVTIESQNRQEAMMHTGTVLYSGEVEGASFAVPEDTLVVYFNFTAESDAILKHVTYNGKSVSGAVPLDYKLLPDFIANRIQGFFANQNLIQRTVFFSDGLKVFSKNPILGQGIGSFETAIFGVQSFYYETKYVHNHYIQTMLETGIIGLLLFVGLIILSAIMVLRSSKREDRHPFVPALGALLVFMGIHAAVEVVFSSGFYLPLALGVFALIGLCCGDAMKLSKKLRTASMGATAIFLITATILLSCNLRAADIGHNAISMKDFQQAAALDPFEWTDYAISYVSNAPTQGSQEVLEQAEEYVVRLDKQQSNTIHYYLAKYCFETGQMERGMEMARKQAKATISSSQWWDKLFLLLHEYDDGSEVYRSGVQTLVELMDQWNQENIGKIVLDDSIQAYVNDVLSR